MHSTTPLLVLLALLACLVHVTADRSDYNPSHYQVLGVTRSASPSEIRRAYHRLALELHPDRHPTDRQGATARFERVSVAYSVLHDPKKRKVYDWDLRQYERGRRRSTRAWTFDMDDDAAWDEVLDRLWASFELHSMSDVFSAVLHVFVGCAILGLLLLILSAALVACVAVGTVVSGLALFAFIIVVGVSFLAALLDLDVS